MIVIITMSIRQLPQAVGVPAPFRKVRFCLARGFVRFYSRTEILALFRSAGSLANFSLVDLGRDYVAIYDVSARARRAEGVEAQELPG